MKKITAILPLLFALNANAQLLETNWSASELNGSCGYVIKGDTRTQSYLGCCTMACAQVAYYYKKCNALQGTNYIELRNFNDYDWTNLDANSYVEDGILHMSYDTSVDFDFIAPDADHAYLQDWLANMSAALTGFFYPSGDTGSDTSRKMKTFMTDLGYDYHVLNTQYTSVYDDSLHCMVDKVTLDESLLRKELEAGHPIIAASYRLPNGGRHCYIIDGYNPSTNKYHYVWGTGPDNRNDGWYHLNNYRGTALDQSVYYACTPLVDATSITATPQATSRDTYRITSHIYYQNGRKVLK